MKSSDIRSHFLSFFKERGHSSVSSSPLVPAGDPTLLFINAGMNQFKELFLGREQRSYVRAVSVQKCIRAGGKHNDLENVGYTARHHTFFEMLGNFSFGDYFKQDAIAWSWEFLTQTLNIPKERLWVTVHKDDQEAKEIWLEKIGIDSERFSRLGDADNFWSMGDTGPCGPCSEIFYDHGDHIVGSPPGGCDEGDRYVEIWNMVFMEYNRTGDGQLLKLPKPSVDTGMGLERIAAVLQNVESNYHTDLFQPLLHESAKVLDCSNVEHPSLKVISDHIRACSFLIADGVTPSNEGRGYVLRRIIRRACSHGYRLGTKDRFFYRLVSPLLAIMGEVYPELLEKQSIVEQVLAREEILFYKTLEKGMSILETHLVGLSDGVIPGEVAFMLYDTYGFPLDLTEDVARERGLTVDKVAFNVSLNAQKQLARSAHHFGVDYNDQMVCQAGDCKFVGYGALASKAKIVKLWVKGQEQEQETVLEGQLVSVLLDVTPFYGESGGQVGDQGIIKGGDGAICVEDTNRQGQYHISRGRVTQGTLALGDRVTAQVNKSLREAITLNHSATHLLHATLRKVLGAHVMQKGSLVTDERLRFDFSHFEAINQTVLQRIESLVNEQIRMNTKVCIENMNFERARETGAIALFTEKYGDDVRVLRMGANDYSIELCGGTHVKRTGNIGMFSIIFEGGVASGVRRIEAVTGLNAERWWQNKVSQLNQISSLLKVSNEKIPDRIQKLVEENKILKGENQSLHDQLASKMAGDLLDDVITIEGVKLLSIEVKEQDPKNLRTLIDQLKNKLLSGVIMLATNSNGRVHLAVGITKDLTYRLQAKDLLAKVAVEVGGKGGGRVDFAQGGGNQPENLKKALKLAPVWLKSELTSSSSSES